MFNSFRNSKNIKVSSNASNFRALPSPSELQAPQTIDIPLVSLFIATMCHPEPAPRSLRSIQRLPPYS